MGGWVSFASPLRIVFFLFFSLSVGSLASSALLLVSRVSLVGFFLPCALLWRGAYIFTCQSKMLYATTGTDCILERDEWMGGLAVG